MRNESQSPEIINFLNVEPAHIAPLSLPRESWKRLSERKREFESARNNLHDPLVARARIYFLIAFANFPFSARRFTAAR